MYIQIQLQILDDIYPLYFMLEMKTNLRLTIYLFPGSGTPCFDERVNILSF